MCVGKDYEKLTRHYLQIVDFTTIAIVIIDDNLAEGVETFHGELSVRGPTQNFSVLITIEILDDEGLLFLYYTMCYECT